jgi:thymidine kinase
MVVQLIIGPMYAGKTTKLFETYNFYGGLIIDFCEGEPNYGTVKNHKDEIKNCIRTPRLSYLTQNPFITDLNEHVNIYINEAQFFPDLLDFIDKFESSKEIRVYGLDGDYRRKPFGQILDIIPYCDTIEKLRGVCVCGQRSIHSKRVTDYKGQFLLDENAYVPACRICFIL